MQRTDIYILEAGGKEGSLENKRFLGVISRSSFNSVIYISVLDHAVCSVAGNDNMIQDQDTDSVEQPLELKCG